MVLKHVTKETIRLCSTSCVLVYLTYMNTCYQCQEAEKKVTHLDESLNALRRV